MLVKKIEYCAIVLQGNRVETKTQGKIRNTSQTLKDGKQAKSPLGRLDQA